MLNLIKKLIHLTKLWVISRFPQIRMVLNYYLTNQKPIQVVRGRSKRVLICYITQPFKKSNFLFHSNQREVVVIAETLSSLNFSIDVVDYNSKSKINYSKYDLIFGFGEAFAASYSDPSFRGIRILHLTGANPNFSNEAEARRSREVMLRRKALLIPRREVYWPWMFSAINSDAIFVLGNCWTESTYKGLNDNIYLLPVPYVEINDVRADDKRFHECKRNFCWFAGSGAIHKGLDLVLDAINQLGEDVHLDVCGPIDNEADFLTLYSDALFQNHKVTYHGFVDVSTDKMQKIIQKNAFVIFPSCSEGGGSSVITCMSAGLIPIVTKEASVNVYDFGISIDSLSVDAVEKSMLVAVSLSPSELHSRSTKSASYAKSYHSYEMYKKSLKNSLINVLNK